MTPVEQVENNMIYPEGYRCHRHRIAADHPNFMRYNISFMNGGQPIQGGDEPPACHEHKKRPFPKTALGEKGHIQTGGSPQE